MSADYGLLRPGIAGSRAEQLTGDIELYAAMLEVETAWLGVLEQHALAPDGSKKSALQASDRILANDAAATVAETAAAAAATGNPIISLLQVFRRELPQETAQALHRTLTSQDIVDTALMLLARNMVQVTLRDLHHLTAQLAQLAQEHQETPQLARTLGQSAAPQTFGLKVAQWFHGLAEAGEKLNEQRFVLQYGGAAGTLAAMTTLLQRAEATSKSSDTQISSDTQLSWETLISEFAAELGLDFPTAPWHTVRAPITEIANALAEVSDACGKLSNDLVLLSRPEFGELAEVLEPGQGSSSAMPHKQNQISAILVRSLALSVPADLQQVHLGAASSIDERPEAGWHLEWAPFRRILQATGTEVQILEGLLSRLRIFPERMQHHLAAAAQLGVDTTQSGQSTQLVDRIIGHYPQWASLRSSSDTAATGQGGQHD